MTDIENLYKRYAGDVRRFALYLCGDVMTADEITSDTFVRAWMAADRIRQPTVKSYLFTIARNAHIDLLRRAARHTQLDWSLAAVLWFLYFARLRRRTAALVCATFFTLIPIPFVLHSLLAGGPVAEFAIFWIIVAFIWLGYFRQRSC